MEAIEIVGFQQKDCKVNRYQGKELISPIRSLQSGNTESAGKRALTI